ncbi:D-alanyl-D-alanine carboxypeptidase/D-alanyl-D-alanine endopeptidase [Deminuibacter soli]|uniref:D-alanyl-D-alanine carboxypeptidase/D-alanyl-D-alanine-endopeptidase n=1 Tax=Deminuibacter soli TaxID=2291815 RepID=A0A3E1NI22_9BACT|nr:D-alanyl-D-alanine carboxypeptidase/D-alanyl-D-alanine-endopeptidase [Deminuibacter soli]RFM27569.1 D-alanyl-D-alanine carboxypeptidase/D-alanyl-D-alanine-endopeptidase [Deminuibacter soli]
MKRIVTALFVLNFCSTILYAQPIKQRLQQAVQRITADAKLKHAIMGFYVVNAQTGAVIYDYNGNTGLAPASTQKIFTSTATLALLGQNYRYTTLLAHNGSISNGVLNGDLLIAGSGDPSFGSWRYAGTHRDSVLAHISAVLRRKGITRITGNVVVRDTAFSYQPIPGGWIWEDIGNYYGAGTWGLNWNENQYDLQLKPGAKEGDTAQVIGTKPALQQVELLNRITTGKAGSGDNSYIYLAPYADAGFAEGTIPAGAGRFAISGAMPNPGRQFGFDLQQYLQTQDVAVNGTVETGWELLNNKQSIPAYTRVLDTMYSPQLDSLVYWFLQKSINLYGETFIKTLARNAGTTGTTEEGVALLRNFWQANGIEPSALKIQDGSGLSPQNRVTANALVTALQFARKQPWFDHYFADLPLYNRMHMKSGTIGGSKAFAGYHTSKEGIPYTFAIIVNNFDGPAQAVVQQMYTVLNELK